MVPGEVNLIGIVDAGIGNLGSLKSAVYNLGFDFVLVRSSAEMKALDALILPGVGSFAHGMEALARAGLVAGIHEHAATGKPTLGICLGMHMFFDVGEEGGGMAGLGLIPGRVRRLTEMGTLPLPHVGWNEMHPKRTHPLLNGIREGVDFYFVHSYRVDCDDKYVVGLTEYGETFPSVVAKENIFGLQFHPEKSQRNGLRILENFCGWDGHC